MLRSAPLPAALAALLILPLRAQAAPVTPVLLFEKSLPGFQGLDFGYLDGGADVDGDGHPDILFGTSNDTYGLVTLYSGGDAHEIASIPGRQSASFLGSSVAFVGDLDGDGVSDFVAAAAGEANAYVYSGATRARLLPRAGLPYGGTVVALGDVDTDGVPDFLETGFFSAPEGFVAAVYSGRTGAALYRVTDPAHELELGHAASIGDVDGDGVTDAIVGDPGADDRSGVVWVISGKTGAILRTYAGSAGQRLGRWVHGVSDISGDGVPDYQIENAIHSGATGEVFFQATGRAVGLGQLDGEGGIDIAMIDGEGFRLYDYEAAQTLGVYRDSDIAKLGSLTMAAIGDVDGDGTMDLAIAGTPLAPAQDSPLFVFRNLRGAPHEAAVDFLPKSCPNVLAGNGGGPLELAILGDAGADVSRIDPSTVRLAGIAPKSSSTKLRDVGTSTIGNDCACPASAGDGIVDLVLRFDADALRAALGPQGPAEVRSLPFSARGEDGFAWFGSDCATSAGRGHRATIAISGQGTAAGLHCVGSNVITAGGAVNLSYRAPAGGEAVRVQVFDLAGRRVAELPEEATIDGVRTARWDGRDARGADVRRGIYFVQARGTVEAGRSVMVVVR
jgi:hypothetical protein